jgi:type I restriction enzyme M protein
MSLSTLIKIIQDIMRKDVGVDGDAQRISQICWLLFLKIFDDKEQEWELTISGYRSPLQSRFRWRNWAKNTEGITGDELIEFVNNELFPALKRLATTAGVTPRGKVVGSVFEDAYNYMKSGTLLRQVINTIEEDVDFNSSKDRHLFNDIYEKILADLQSAGNAGEYYTPRAVTQFMVDILNPRLGESILDPACGTGGFLTCAIEHLKKQAKTAEDMAILQDSINGVEKKPLPHMLAMTNVMLHGIDVPTRIRHDNTLSRPFKDYGPKDRVDIVLTNPPFGGMEEDGIENNFLAKHKTRETADLFMALIMHLLKHNTGRAAVVLPDGFLFGEGVKTTLKRELLEEFNLHTIVRMPKGVFAPYTSINTNILFFEKGGPTKDVWFFEHPYPDGYKSYSRGKPLTIEEFDLEKKWWGGATRKGRKITRDAWKVAAKEIAENNYNLDAAGKNPHRDEVQNGDPVKLMAEYQRIVGELKKAQAALKAELMAALTASNGGRE